MPLSPNCFSEDQGHRTSLVILSGPHLLTPNRSNLRELDLSIILDMGINLNLRRSPRKYLDRNYKRKTILSRYGRRLMTAVRIPKATWLVRSPRLHLRLSRISLRSLQVIKERRLCLLFRIRKDSTDAINTHRTRTGIHTSNIPYNVRSLRLRVSLPCIRILRSLLTSNRNCYMGLVLLKDIIITVNCPITIPGSDKRSPLLRFRKAGETTAEERKSFPRDFTFFPFHRSHCDFVPQSHKPGVFVSSL